MQQLRVFLTQQKLEMVNHQGFKGKQEAKLAIFEFVEVERLPLRLYRKGRHSSLGYLTALAFEQKLQKEK